MEHRGHFKRLIAERSLRRSVYLSSQSVQMRAATEDSRSTSAAAMDGGTRAFVLWMLFVVFCQCAGWGLSALHDLNRTGYAVAFFLFFAGVVFWSGKHRVPLVALPPIARLKKRFTRPFPIAFVTITTLAILGGALYPPNNYDGLTYRTPRVLHWLAEGGWHWIRTDYGTLNSRTAGFEWLTAPLFAFTKNDRFEFLLNAICFLFLPGRVFATLVRFGVRRRVAYYWMWIFPAGYGFLLQAGSIGNDMFCALWPIAAFEFALRARDAKRVQWLWLSILAAALMTASKAFNILLLPAWGLAILPSIRLLLGRPLASFGIVVIAAISSMIPTAILNIHYCGDWTGLTVEPVLLDNGPPLFNLSVNSVLVLVQNFAPPIFPFSGAWDRLVSHVVPSTLGERLTRFFEPDAARFRIPELQAEESAGLGFGVCVLLLLIVLRQLFLRPQFRRVFVLRNLTSLAALGGAAIFMMKSGLYAPARYLLPLCFPIIVPILALPAACTIARSKCWRGAALMMFAIAAVVLIIAPARPLWPAATAFRAVNSNSSPLLQRAANVYSTYRGRNDALRTIREALPADLPVVGFIAVNTPETSLWRPFGSRRVVHIRHDDSPEFVRARGIRYVVMHSTALGYRFKITPEEWLRRYNGEIIQQFPVQLIARGEPSNWLLIRLNP